MSENITIPEQGSGMKQKIHPWLEKFLPETYFPREQPKLLNQAKVTVLFSLGVLLPAPFFLAADLARGIWMMAVINLCTVVLLTLPPLLLRFTGSISLATNFLMGGLYFSLASLVCIDGGFGSMALIGDIILPMISVLLMGYYGGFQWTLLVMLKFAIFFQARNISTGPFLTNAGNEQAVVMFIALLGLAAMSMFVSLFYEKVRSDALHELEESNKKLAQRNLELDQAREVAEKASRAKTEFVANVSHEFRTPLKAIVGYSDLLQECIEDDYDPNMVLSDLRKIRQAGDHLNMLIDDILDLSKMEAGALELFPEEFAVDLLMESVVNTAVPLARKNNNQLCWEGGAISGVMITDITRVRQILLNLVSNACKFTRRGRVELRVTSFQRGRVSWYRFEVEDNGIGISPEQREKLFRKFSQGDSSTTKRYGGTGLGLALSKKLCDLMGGIITVKSCAGEGSVFILELPAILPLLDRSLIEWHDMRGEDLSPHDSVVVSLLDEIPPHAPQTT